MNTDLITTQDSSIELTTGNSLSHPFTIGQVANSVAAKHAFSDYRSRKAKQTLRRQDNDLALFAQYLGEVGMTVDNLAEKPESWQAVTWGLVEGFVKWQLQRGYTVSTANVRLSTAKTYAKLAVKAGTLDKTEYAMVRVVSGYSHKESKRIDASRKAIDLPTRLGYKKAEAVSITKAQADELKHGFYSEGPQGRRDALLMCLLLDHGLRVGEVAILQVSNINIQTGELTFYRPKVDKVQTHKLTKDTLKYAIAYIENDALPNGPLLRASLKNGELSKAGIGDRGITKRVFSIGKMIGIEGLSAHDLRHYSATYHAKTKDVKELMEIFGWNSPAMAVRYIADQRVIDLD